MVTVRAGIAEFSFYRPEAKSVSIAGDFNGWRDGELTMMQSSDGYWHASVQLPVGEFKFRYCSDGEWFTDYAAFGVEPGRFGMDSIVRVPVEPVVKTVAAERTLPQVAAA